MRGALLGLVAGLALAAPAGAADHPVAFASYAYTPPDLTIAVNDTVTFGGTGGEDFSDHPLDWTGDVFTETATGSSKQFTFSTPGTYPYVCRFHVTSQGMKGVIRVAGNQHPARVSFSTSPTTATVGQPVTFDASGSTDADGSVVRYEWDLDGASTQSAHEYEVDGGSTPSIVHAFSQPTGVESGIRVGVRVTDDDGRQATFETFMRVRSGGNFAPRPVVQPAARTTTSRLFAKLDLPKLLSTGRPSGKTRLRGLRLRGRVAGKLLKPNG